MTDDPPGETPRPADGSGPSRLECENCGREIDPADWHPVATEVDEDDSFHLYTFCCEACRDEWQAESDDE